MTTEANDTHNPTPANKPLALVSSAVLGPKRTEWTEIRLALRQEYGHPYTYNGAQLYDFSRHVYVGRAGALLLKAEKIEAAMRELVECQDISVRAAEMAMTGKARAEDLQRMYDEFTRRMPPAWAEARRLLGA
jgi:hypothetical protein